MRGCALFDFALCSAVTVAATVMCCIILLSIHFSMLCAACHVKEAVECLSWSLSSQVDVNVYVYVHTCLSIFNMMEVKEETKGT